METFNLQTRRHLDIHFTDLETLGDIQFTYLKTRWRLGDTWRYIYVLQDKEDTIKHIYSYWAGKSQTNPNLSRTG